MAVDYSKSVQHLQSYPVVADTYGYIYGYYTWAKEKSTIINYTCGLAENGLVMVASPLAKTFESQVKTIDEVADGQLRRLDSRFPSVKKPTRELWEDSRNYYDSTVEAVYKPISQSYDSVCAQVYAGKESSMQYVKQVIDSADRYVDTYLPSDEEELELSTLPADYTAEEEKESAGVSVRSRAVLRKAQRRLYRRGKMSVEQTLRVAHSAVTDVVNKVGLLEKVKTAQAGLGDLNTEFWNRLETQQKERLSKDDSETTSSEKPSEDGTTRAIDLATRSVLTATQVLNVLSDMIYHRLDSNNKTRWDQTNQSIQEFYSKLRESPQTITVPYLQRIRELFHDISLAFENGYQRVSGDLTFDKDSIDSTSSEDDENQVKHV